MSKRGAMERPLFPFEQPADLNGIFVVSRQSSKTQKNKVRDRTRRSVQNSKIRSEFTRFFYMEGAGKSESPENS
jgi:hypothetical protein